LDENLKIKWNYKTDGYDHSGVKIPDFPVLNLLIEKPNGEKISDPAENYKFIGSNLSFFSD